MIGSSSSTPSQKSSIHTLTRSELKATLEETLQTQLEQQQNEGYLNNFGYRVKQPKKDISKKHFSDKTIEKNPQIIVAKPPRVKTSHLTKPVTDHHSNESACGDFDFLENASLDDMSIPDSTDYQIGFEKIEKKVRASPNSACLSSINDCLNSENDIEKRGSNVKRLPMKPISNMCNNVDKTYRNPPPVSRDYLKKNNSGETDENKDFYLTVGFSPAENKGRGEYMFRTLYISMQSH